MELLTQPQKDLIVGTLLGDGNLQTFSKGKTWRYRAIQQKNHSEYLFHKYETLEPLCATAPKEGEVFDERTGKYYKRLTFNTLTNAQLKPFADMFYTYNASTNKWVKNVPLDIENHLTPRAVTYFYMDDGALKWLGHSNAMRVCTESFSLDGVNRIQKALTNLYNINTTLTKKTLMDGTVGHRLAIPEGSSSKFRDLVQPYLIDCLKYKVSDGNKGHL